MGTNGKRGLINKTTNRKTHNLLHIKCVTSCCLICAKRQRRTYYCIREYNGKKDIKIPSWKLVSKNRKQWMKKPLKYVEKISRYPRYSYFYTEITW